MVMRAMGAFKQRITGQQRHRAAGELRKSDTHQDYPHHSDREHARHTRQEIEGRIPREQLGRIVDDRVVGL